MAKKYFKAVLCMVVCLLPTLLGFTGCSTTQSIVFSTSQQPTAGEYKYVTISATVSDSGNAGSVLQRFYEQYPPDKYEVIACELQRKNYLPTLAGLGGGLLGSLIFLPTAFNSDDFGTGMAIGFMGIGFSVPIGVMIGDAYKDKYVITYIERTSP